MSQGKVSDTRDRRHSTAANGSGLDRAVRVSMAYPPRSSFLSQKMVLVEFTMSWVHIGSLFPGKEWWTPELTILYPL